MKALFLAAALAAATFFANTADAQCARPARNTSVQQMHNNQLIRRNAAHGGLTRAEATRLRARQRGVRQDIRLAKADGRITAPERRIIHREQRNLRYDIRRQSHDRQVRRY